MIIEKDGIHYTPCFGGYAVKGAVTPTMNGTIKIPSFVNGIKVVRILANAFANNDWLKEIYLPCDVESIEERAFYDCKGLKNVVFAGIHYSGVVVGRAAFYNCSSLEKIGRPLRLDGAYVFQNCYNLTSVTVVGAVPIGSFWGDYKLKTIHFFPEENSDVYISDGSFTGCNNIKSAFFYANNVEVKEKDLDLLRNAAIYCEEGCNLWDLYYDGYDVRVML